MAAARYWRLIAFETYGYRADLELSEIALYEAAIRVDAGATISSSVAPSSGTLASLSDVSTSTVALWLGADVAQPGFSISWDFGGTPRDINEVRFSSGTSVDRFIYSTMIQSSSDAVTWSTIGVFRGPVYPGNNAEAAPWTFGDDPYFANVVTQLHMDGVNAGTSFPDSSSLGVVWTPVNATTSTAQKKYGSASGNFPGNSYLWAPANSAFDIRSGAFTMRGFVRLNATGTGTLFSKISTSSGIAYEWSSYISSTAIEFYWGIRGSNQADLLLQTPVTLAINTWYHWQLSRSAAGVWRGFIDGVQCPTYNYAPLAGALSYGGVTAGNLTNAVDLGSTPIPLWIGTNPFGTSYFNGYMDEMEFTVGIERNSANFTPPAAPALGMGFNPTTRRINLAQANTVTVNSQSVGNTVSSLKVSSAVALDREDGGRYRVVGTVKEKALPSNTPLRRKVRLFNELTGRMIREAWSDATTGAYSFDYVRGDQKYTVVSYDYQGNYRAVIADNVTPDLIP